MLLVQVHTSHITEILNSDRPIAFVPAESRDHAEETAISARDGRFGVAVIEERSGQVLVVVVGDEGQATELRRFVGRYWCESHCPAVIPGGAHGSGAANASTAER